MAAKLAAEGGHRILGLAPEGMFGGQPEADRNDRRAGQMRDPGGVDPVRSVN
ncbi:MAG: hypothetical protein R3D61_15280 [Defluviimonas denitrificans]